MMFMFLAQSAALGLGLAMDAFSVSLVRGLNDPKMKKSGMLATAGCFAFFQALMPLIGWVCVHTVVEHFKSFDRYIPWIALLVLFAIGAKMMADGLKHRCGEENEEKPKNGAGALIVQGIATSIDALSAGLTIEEHNLPEALTCVLIIAVITFVLCLAGVALGKRFGCGMAGKAEVFGGVILMLIGVKVFVEGLLGK